MCACVWPNARDNNRIMRPQLMLIPRGISFEMCALLDWSMRPQRIRLELPRKTHIDWWPVREEGGVRCVSGGCVCGFEATPRIVGRF